IRFMSSPCPAIPTINVPARIGTTIILIILRNTLEKGFSPAPISGASQPVRAPRPMQMKIQPVRPIRRFEVVMVPGNSVVNQDDDGTTSRPLDRPVQSGRVTTDRSDPPGQFMDQAITISVEIGMSGLS